MRELLLLLSLYISVVSQQGYHLPYVHLRHQKHYSWMTPNSYGGLSYYNVFNNPPPYFNPFFKGNLELTLECPKSTICATPLPAEKTLLFTCADDRQCPTSYKCCQNSCFAHKVCRPAALISVKPKTTTEATRILTTTPKPNNESTVQRERTGSQNCCPKEVFPLCSRALDSKRTSIFKCFSDSQCPAFYKCCTCSCFAHNVCRPTSSFNCNTSPEIRTTSTFTTNTSTITTEPEYPEENGNNGNSGDDTDDYEVNENVTTEKNANEDDNGRIGNDITEENDSSEVDNNGEDINRKTPYEENGTGEDHKDTDDLEINGEDNEEDYHEMETGQDEDEYEEEDEEEDEEEELPTLNETLPSKKDDESSTEGNNDNESKDKENGKESSTNMNDSDKNKDDNDNNVDKEQSADGDENNIDDDEEIETERDEDGGADENEFNKKVYNEETSIQVDHNQTEENNINKTDDKQRNNDTDGDTEEEEYEEGGGEEDEDNHSGDYDEDQNGNNDKKTSTVVVDSNEEIQTKVGAKKTEEIIDSHEISGNVNFKMNTASNSTDVRSAAENDNNDDEYDYDSEYYDIDYDYRRRF